jgi:hypothetical protein
MIQPRLSIRGKCHLSFTSSESSAADSQKSIRNDDVEDVHEHQQQQQQKQLQFTTETVDSDDGEQEEEEFDDDSTPSRTAPVVAPPAPVTATEAPKKKIVKKVSGA